MDVQPERSKSAEAIGPYRILGRLGVGGMGEVFLAYDGRLDRRVAIKRIRPESGARPERRERFRREARMAARLSHPAIVQVYDILQENGLDYIVMEYVEGESLREKVARGPLAVRQVLDLARELADGLEAAHQQGIVHRDLKSENVLVTPSGRPKVTDFGIAKLLLAEEGEESLTADDAVIGTCRSMSPEQARGEAVDHRTDLFALGVLLYEMLTGTSPFAAENRLATLNRVIHSRQRPVRELAPAVPEELSRLVDHLLVKEPRLRPQSAGQVRRELERLALATADGGGETSEEISPPTASSELPTVEGSEIATVLQPVERSTAEKPQRNSALSTSGVLPRRWMWLAVLALILGGGIWAWLALRPARPPLYVAVLAPEIGAGAGNGEIELLASGVRVALLQGLVSLEGISPQAFEEVDAASGSPREIARAVAADELVGTRLDCRSEVCQVSLTRRRGVDGSVVQAESFEMPTDDSAMVASVARSHLKQLYADRVLRRGWLDLEVDKLDLDEFLRLRKQFEGRREPSQEAILAGLATIRRRSPGFAEAYLLEASVRRRRFWASRDAKELELGLKLIEEARRLAPSDPRPLIERVDFALETRKLDLAQHSLGELERLIPGDARLLERQARTLSVQGQAEESLKLMREAVRRQPSAKRLHNLAQMELQAGQTTEASQTLDLLLVRSPRNFDGLSLRAQVALSSGDLDRAVELYTELVRISPGLVELGNLGLAQFFRGRYAEAAKIFERTLSLQPNHPVLVLNLADSYLLLGRKPEAEALYRRVIELIKADPTATGPQFLTVKAQALAHLGEGRQAVAALQEALRLAPDQGPVAFEAALVYALLDEDDSALANVEIAIRSGIGKQWFSLPWFRTLEKHPDFQKLLQEARPGLG